MVFDTLVTFHRFQHVEIGNAVLDVLVQIGVCTTNETIALSGNEWADASIFAGLLSAPLDEEPDVVDLGFRLPTQQYLAIASGDGKAGQRHSRVGG